MAKDDDETVEGQPAEEPGFETSEDEAAGEVAASEEPGTEAEAPVEEGDVTQEAPVEEAAGEGDEGEQIPAFVEEYKPKSDIYTLVLVLTFLAFVTVIVLAGMEAHEFYDVQFWLFKKE